MSKHELQHPDAPTWCVNCGKFDVYCNSECAAEPTREFDSSVPANHDRMLRDLFGVRPSLTPKDV